MTAIDRGSGEKSNLDHLGDIEAEIVVELGRKKINFSAARQLRVDDFIEFKKLAGEAFDVTANGQLFAEGEIVVVTDLMAIRLTRMAELPREQEKSDG